MKKSNSNYINILLIIVSIIQISIFIKFSMKENNKISVENQLNKEFITFKDVNDHLLGINQLKILEMENKDDGWNAKVMLTGNENSIKENLNLFKKYKIIAYTIDGSNGDFNVTLDIIRKNN